MTLFFASNFLEIIHAQNAANLLKLSKEETVLVLWITSVSKDLGLKADPHIFSDIIFISRPLWREHIFTGRSNLQKTIHIISGIIDKYKVSEIFIPDPERDFQILEHLCKTKNVDLSLYETGIEVYRYLENEDPNRFSLRYRFSRISLLYLNIVIVIKHLFRRNVNISGIIFFHMIPELGQFLFAGNQRKILFRIKNFHRCLCTNSVLISKLYNVDIFLPLTFENIISDTQQMLIFSSPEFWDISANTILFIDQNYQSLGITLEQHVQLVLHCLEHFGRTKDIVIKPNWALTAQISKIYKKAIAKKGYKIQIISSEVLVETIIKIKQTRQIVSLAGSTYTYSVLTKPDIRALNFYKKYEELAKDLNLNKKIIKNIEKHHKLFNTVFDQTQKIQQITPLNDSFYIYQNH